MYIYMCDLPVNQFIFHNSFQYDFQSRKGFRKPTIDYNIHQAQWLLARKDSGGTRYQRSGIGRHSAVVHVRAFTALVTETPDNITSKQLSVAMMEATIDTLYSTFQLTDQLTDH